MKLVRCLLVRGCSCLKTHPVAMVLGWALICTATLPSPAWGQCGAQGPTIFCKGGNVGIGTTDPASILHIRPGITANANLLVTGQVSVGGSVSLATVNDALNANTPLEIRANPTVFATGNVGIGTTTPGGRLDVQGGRSFFAPASERFGVGVRYSSASGAVYFGANDNTATPGVQISAATGAPLMTLQNDGNVGIGTTSPQHMLSVKGKIGAGEVIVTDVTGWADYVFKPGYRLQSLSEVDAYIQTNRHLPDVPSEAEVKEKGVSVGEMQSKLLAKVEELTLHMIRQEKENRALREHMSQREIENGKLREQQETENRKLRARLEQLETRAIGAERVTAPR